LEGGFYRNEGNYLNRADIIPDDGLYSAGVSIDLLQGSWINKRMATLKMAKAFQKKTLAEREIILNNLL
ncbi:MAG: transporter, partial [Crocinitomicaceae bacterium]